MTHCPPSLNPGIISRPAPASALPCIALHRTALHRIALHCIALQCVALHCIALHRIASHRIARLTLGPAAAREPVAALVDRDAAHPRVALRVLERAVGGHRRLAGRRARSHNDDHTSVAGLGVRRR